MLFKNSIKLSLNLDDWIQQHIYFLNTYEEAELNFISKQLIKGDTFVDIGANFGLYSLVASRIVGATGTIISFEPFQENLTKLKTNIALNNYNNITVVQKAIVDKNAQLQLRYHPKEANLGMVSAYLEDFAITQNVPAIALDSYFEENKIKQVDFIKMDIEGGEFLALKGMQKLLQKFKPTLLVEILPDEYTINNEDLITNLLSTYGYKKWFVKEDGTLSQQERNHIINFVFLHSSNKKSNPIKGSFPSV